MLSTLLRAKRVFVLLIASIVLASLMSPLLWAGLPSMGSMALSGTVVDPSGAAIVGAQVKLQRACKLMAENSAHHDGAFRFDKLAFGIYELDVHAAGFRDFETTLTIDAKQREPIRIRMSIATGNEVVTVGASVPTVSTVADENQNANTIDRNALDLVPLFDQDYITTMSRFLNDDQTGTNGITLVVNGIEANGPGVTASAVQQVKINQNPYSARFSRPGRARLEIITKGGTPQYHGSLNFLFRDSVSLP
jgi:hypothetical protein